MPLHEVTAEAAVGTQGALEIHPGFRNEAAEIGPGEGLSQQVEACRLLIGRGDGETAAIDGQAFAKGEPGGERGLQSQAGSITAPVKGTDATDRFDKSGEHAVRLPEKEPTDQR